MVEVDHHADKRSKILANSLENSNAPGWGYFGMSASLAIGDNSYAPKMTRKPPAEGDEGDPLRNMVTAPVKKGAATDVYFQFETPLALGDPYMDPHRVGRKGKQWMLDPEASFKPPGAVRASTNKLGYNYVEHCDTAKDPKEVREKYRDYQPPRNMLTNPAKKGGGGVLTGGVLFGHGEERGQFTPHIPDDFDAPRKFRQKELAEHREKLGEKPAFRGPSYGNRQFADNEETFHCPVPSHIPVEKKPVDTSRRFPHESSFKPANPSKKGAFHGSIGTFPPYMEDPVPGGAVRKPVNENPPAPYRIGNPRSVTNPTASIVTNMRNMRNERPRSFSRPVL